MSKNKISAEICLMVLLFALPLVASAAAPLDGGGVLTSTVTMFQNAAGQWAAVLAPAAKHLFLGLAIMAVLIDLWREATG